MRPTSPNDTELPLDSRATLPLRKKTWIVVLRCFRCNGRFAVKGVHLDRIALIPQVTPCAHCSAEPIFAPEGWHGIHNKLHRILDLREEEH
ncbi:MAG TPA: hypothetical protein VGL70_12575 [Candidatus Binatia bacterium]|jgi:hypothetical protein